MLIIQPEDHPTAEGALSHGWLAGLKRNTEGSDENEDGTTQRGNESTLSRKRKKILATNNRPKKRRSERNPIGRDRTGCIQRDVGLVANSASQMGSDPTERILGTAMIPSDAADTPSSLVQMGPQTPGLVPCNFEATHSKSTKVLRKGEMRNVAQTSDQGTVSSRIPN